MCSHRLAVARLVREYKEPLFSPVSSQVSRQNKQELWEHIRQQAVSQGATQYGRKSWKEIRDCVWAPIRRDTMAKLNKARTVGEDTVLFTEIDRVVLDIIGTNGTEGGGDGEHDENGIGAGGSANNNGSIRSMGGSALDDTDGLNFTALVAELAAADGGGIGGVGGGSEFKPNTSTLSQMIGGLDQFAAVLNGSAQNGAVNIHQQQQHNNNSISQFQQQPQLMMTNGLGRSDNKAPTKRRALELTSQSATSPVFLPPSSPSSFIKGNPILSTDLELDRATKQARLEQIRLQNLLIQEQIEERRLQNQLLRMDIQKRQREEEASD